MNPRKRINLALLTTIAVCATGLIGAPGASAKAKGFSYGVASGDVTSSSAILWAKANKGGKTYLQVKDSGSFGGCDANRAVAKVKAKKDQDFTVQALVKKLDPATEYKYRYCTSGGGHSDTGTFTTAPGAKSNRTIRFALSGDQDARPIPGGTAPYWNNFEIWKRILKQDNDFNVMMGDTIYSDTEVPGYGLSDVALSVKQKWEAYKTNLAMKPWMKARGATSYYAHWDDHEFVNDFSRFENSFPLSVGDVNMSGEQLYKNGVQAFTRLQPGHLQLEDRDLPLRPLGQEPRGLLPRRALLPQHLVGLPRGPATTRPAAATPTWRRPPRRARATCSRRSRRRSPTRPRRRASPRSTTPTGRCSARSSWRRSKRRSRSRPRRSR